VDFARLDDEVNARQGAGGAEAVVDVGHGEAGRACCGLWVHFC
jgi:hypothetical protein